MTWVRIDDEFEDNPKVAPLSDAAHRVWLMANCWCKKPVNFHTHGFVPESMLPTISKNRYKPAQLTKLVDELVNARVGGTKEHGLWELREGGWQFHDWEKYLSKEDLKEIENGPTMTRSQAASVAGQRSRDVRRAKHGTAQPKRSNVVPNEPERRSEESPERFSNDVPNDSRTPDPDPDPDPKDLKGNSKEPDSSDPSRSAAAVSCPANLNLDAAQRGNLEMIGMEPWQIDAMVAAYVVKKIGDPNEKKPLPAWIKCLAVSVMNDWNSGKRPRRPQLEITQSNEVQFA